MPADAAGRAGPGIGERADDQRGFDKVESAYFGEGHRTSITTTTAAGAVATRAFRYQSNAIVEERLTDAGGSSASGDGSSTTIHTDHNAVTVERGACNGPFAGWVPSQEASMESPRR
jgi:hypothetical protein